MEIPKEIEVGGYKFKIEWTDEATDRLSEDNYFGVYIRSKRTIRLKNNISQQEIDNTFIHEIIHVVDDIFLCRKLQEENIDSLANGLHQVFSQLGINFSLPHPRGDNE